MHYPVSPAMADSLILWGLLNNLMKSFWRTIFPGDEIGNVYPSPPILMVYRLLHWVLILLVLSCWCVRAEQLPETYQDLASGKTWERANGTWQGTSGKLVTVAEAGIGSKAKRI